MDPIETLSGHAADQLSKAAATAGLATDATQEVLSTAAESAADAMTTELAEPCIAAVMAAPVHAAITESASEIASGASDAGTGSGITGYFGNLVKGFTTTGPADVDTVTDITSQAVDTTKSSFSELGSSTAGKVADSWGSRFFNSVSEAYSTASKAALSAGSSAWEWAQQNPNYAAAGVIAATAVTAIGTGMYVRNRRAKEKQSEDRTLGLQSKVSELEAKVHALQTTEQAAQPVPGGSHAWPHRPGKNGML